MRNTLVALALTATTLLAGTATAAASPEQPDLHAGACELSWALHSGQPIAEDLSFPDATPTYAAANDTLADLFWETQPAGADWPAAGVDLEDWLDDQITRPCSDIDSGA